MKLIHLITNCGLTTTFLSKKYLGISKKTLDNYVADNTLIKSNHILFSKSQTIYKLSDKTINQLRNKSINIYKSDFTQLEHDYLLSKLYLSISDSERVTWQNETALKSRFGKNATTCDAMYVKNNKLIGVEILTSDYRKETIKEKNNFMEKYCDEKIIINTSDFERR